MTCFERLIKFINVDMRMSHIYQPVMLIELLQNSGKASKSDIAKKLLSYDISQLEYYEKIVSQMPGKVLTNNRGITSRDKNIYELINYDKLSQSQIDQLISACEVRISDYIQARGESIWNHRKQSKGYISGTLRYEVLKRAKRRCELCGISDDIKGLEIDHIIPRKFGGSDDISNLQALCYSCNSMKGARDDEDLRDVISTYSHRKADCIFCDIDKSRIVEENSLAYAIRDAFPVTELHTLIIPKRHVEDYFDCYQPEINAMNQLVSIVKDNIKKDDDSVKGFNLGVNSGVSAGQTVMHCHMHLIPRRNGDAESPEGGVRGVIPSKQKYIEV